VNYQVWLFPIREATHLRKDPQPTIWGAAGTNGQHSFYQLLLQDSDLIPVDFLAPATSHNPLRSTLHHRILLSNFFAQPEALAFGKTQEQVREEVGLDATEELIESKAFDGNRPSNSIIFPQLTPATLGSLIAMYEHKIFTLGVVWGINSYGGSLVLPHQVHNDKWSIPDQVGMGVELGKVLAKETLAQLNDPADVKGHDSSVSGLP
jgi:glucose-6-phosphate isomerase